MMGPEGGCAHVADGATETIGGVISDISLRQTKRGDTFAILTIEDLVGSIEVFVWPDTYQKVQRKCSGARSKGLSYRTCQASG